jgi:acyl transferase domain-containing protein
MRDIGDRTSNPWSQILHTLGCVYLDNVAVSFEAANGTGKVVIDLPSYPWNHKTRHWHQSRVVEQTRCADHAHREILGSRTAESSGLEPSWRNLLRLEDVPWLWDHVLQGNVIFPGAGYIAMVGEAACQLDPRELPRIIPSETSHSKRLSSCAMIRWRK